MKFKKQIWLLVSAFILIAVFSGCEKEPQKPYVARVGERTITVEEFKNTLQFNPYLVNLNNKAQAKRLMLASLIAEKMLAQEAENTYPSLYDSLQPYIDQYEREAIYESFWEKEIEASTKISEEELRRAYVRSKQKKIVQYLVFAGEAAAQGAYNQLKKGMTFERLAQIQGFPAGSIPVDTVRSEGKLPFFEEKVFKLELGQISEPLRVNNRYFIVKLINEKTNVATSPQDFEYHRQSLKKKLKRFKNKKAFLQYANEHLPDPPYQFRKNVFRELVRSLEKRIFSTGKPLREDRLNARIAEIYLKNNGDELQALKRKELVKFEDGTTWSVAKWLQRLETAPYPVLSENRGQFRGSLLKAAKNILDDEVIVQHAKGKGLHNTEYVKRQTQIRKDFMLYQYMVKQIKNDKVPANLNERLQQRILTLKNECNIEVNKTLLDTMKVNQTNMTVLKRHFPARTMTPILSPMAGMEKWNRVVQSMLQDGDDSIDSEG